MRFRSAVTVSPSAASMTICAAGGNGSSLSTTSRTSAASSNSIGSSASRPSSKAVKIEKNLHLRAQDVAVDRLEEVIDGAVLVALEDVRRLTGNRGDQDDRDVARALALLDQLGGL